MSDLHRHLRTYREIGADAHLAFEDMNHPRVVGGLDRTIWDVYMRDFGGFTGSQLDPLFHRFDHGNVDAGTIKLRGDDAVLIVGTGPSTAIAVPTLRRLRDTLYIITSLRGTSALADMGISPDLILIEHPSALDAELSTREARDLAAPRISTTVGIAIQWRTPGELVTWLAGPPRRSGPRPFIPTPFPSWGLWPATAAAMALEAGSRRIGLLGVDLGSAAGIDPVHRRLASLLALVSSLSPGSCVDCGSVGAMKTGWTKLPLHAFAPPRRTSGPMAIAARPLKSRTGRIGDAEAILRRLVPVLEYADAALEMATRLRASRNVKAQRGSILEVIDEMMAWKERPSLRAALQDTLGISFLPRMWRTGIRMDRPEQLCRPVILALREVTMQAAALRKRIETVQQWKPWTPKAKLVKPQAPPPPLPPRRPLMPKVVVPPLPEAT